MKRKVMYRTSSTAHARVVMMLTFSAPLLYAAIARSEMVVSLGASASSIRLRAFSPSGNSDFDGANPLTKLGDVFMANTSGSFAQASYSLSSQGYNARVATKGGGPDLNGNYFSADAFLNINYVIHSTNGGNLRARVGFGPNSNYVGAISSGTISLGLVSNQIEGTQHKEWEISAVWTDGDNFPGEDPVDSLEGGEIDGDEPEDIEISGRGIFDDVPIDGVDIANDVTGGYLTGLPVSDTYGFSQHVYLEVAEQVLDINSATPLIFVSDNALTSLELPSLTSTGTFSVEVDGVTHTVASGGIIDFTTFDPDGISYFTIWPSVPGAPLPSSIGLKFGDEVPTNVFQGVLVPEPSSLWLAGWAGLSVLACARRLRRRPA